ncbi:hypothetical protein M878_16470 [Streptomyces roseochromogenus subsp. oscitans DS 12.976]|uniref:Uncharacterized protein n=1 Tax=Streptomyces roseochromogenus subsp. oscitans DS 12.976 TaxID=1352936 RepID=V6KHN3_STRRC|nr:hypothetical protein M878_16470 [Streptomyces roseochromogenus subsp. oscitans DS 12.976]
MSSQVRTPCSEAGPWLRAGGAGDAGASSYEPGAGVRIGHFEAGAVTFQAGQPYGDRRALADVVDHVGQ